MFKVTERVGTQLGDSQVALVVNNLPTSAEDMRLGFDPWVGKIS